MSTVPGMGGRPLDPRPGRTGRSIWPLVVRTATRRDLLFDGCLLKLEDEIQDGRYSCAPRWPADDQGRTRSKIVSALQIRWAANTIGHAGHSGHARWARRHASRKRRCHSPSADGTRPYWESFWQPPPSDCSGVPCEPGSWQLSLPAWRSSPPKRCDPFDISIDCLI
jgi:hypothetical protein